MVAIRSMERRVARLGREAFTDLLVNDPTLDQGDIADVYWAVKAWHDDPGTWVPL
ncbi:MAG: hypothetical protein M3Y27_02320 [Acidobacteriota bacterium]|nr:hypothetical protein [Acidobacteriota bacterium]